MPLSSLARRPFLLVACWIVAVVRVAALGTTPPEYAPTIVPAPDWVDERPWTPPARLETNPTGEDYLLIDEQVRVVSAEDYRHNVFQIVSEAGRQSSSQVTYYFDPTYQRLRLHWLRVIRDGVATDRLDPAKIELLQQERDLDRQMYNGELSALLILDDVRVGDIVDTAYTLVGRNPVFGDHFIDSFSNGWSVPVRELNYRALALGNRNLRHHTLGGPALEPQAAVKDAGPELWWHRRDIPVIESIERLPATEFLYPFVELSDFASWTDVARWAAPLYAAGADSNPMVDEVAAGIAARESDPEKQVVAALAWVQQEVRYLGIEMGPGTHRPSAPETVLRRRFGDCKDKAALLVQILHRLNFRAVPALVHSSREKAVKLRLPTPYAFDHVIVALDLGGRRYLLDPTLSYQRGRSLAERHVGHYGPYLRVAADNTVGLEHAVLGPGDDYRTTVEQEFQVPAFDQPAKFTVVTTATGAAAASQRSYFATSSTEQINRAFLDYYTRYYTGITRERDVQFEDFPDENRVRITERYVISPLFATNGQSTTLRAEFNAPIVLDYLRVPNLAQRQHPYSLTYPAHVSERVTIHLPETWNVTPEDERVEDPAFQLHAVSSRPEPRTVVLEYEWTSLAPRVETPRLVEFGNRLARGRKLVGYELSWTPPDPSPKPAPTLAVFLPNWPMIGLAGGLCLGAGYVSLRLASRANREPPLLSPADDAPRAPRTPSGLGGWLILVGLGVCLRPAFIATQIIKARSAYFDQGVWNRLTRPESSTYSPHFSLLAPLEMGINLGLLVFSLLLVILYFRRSHLFPRSLQGFLLLSAVAPFYSWWNGWMLGQKTAETLPQDVAGALLAAAIWITYLQVSQRVKNTFVR